MARQLRTQLEQEVTIEEMAKARPMQAGPAAAAASAPETSSAYSQYPPAEAFASSPPPPADFDLDAMVSGIEPPADAVMKAAQPAGEIAAAVAAPAPIEPGADSKSG
jgi:hypothetical protein